MTSRSQIMRHINTLVKSFYDKVYTRARRKSSKKKGIIFEKVSIRVAIREWRKENDKLFDVGLSMEKCHWKGEGIL